MRYAVITSFPDSYWSLCAREMLQGIAQHWPKEVDLYIYLDDKGIVQEVMKCDDKRANVFISVEKTKEHLEFLKRNNGRDSATDYRKQASRFSHKVAAIWDTLKFWEKNPDLVPDYFIWLDADVLTKKPVTLDWLTGLMPKDEEVVSYLGRKDWPHSECGFLGFKTGVAATELVNRWWDFYRVDKVFEQQQWDDSWLFDLVRPAAAKNLSPAATGNHVWPQTKLAECLEHLKGPVAKQPPLPPVKQEVMSGNEMCQIDGKPLRIQTVNAIKDEEILRNIDKNRFIIAKWIKQQCKPHKETAIIVSAGSSLDVEEVRKLAEKPRHRVIAVKHAVSRLLDAGITPWAVILLDPRGHVADFVDRIPKETLVFVASQCDPSVARRLVKNGNQVIGYHAPVNAQHEWENGDLLINGGSATATRGLQVLVALGFRDFDLFGYDLCYWERPKNNPLNEQGCPKYLQVEMSPIVPHENIPRSWWTEGQFIAQANELRMQMEQKNLRIRAHGEGVAAWLHRSKKRSDLIEKELRDKIGPIRETTLYEFLGESVWTKSKNYLLNLLNNKSS